jgi:hypothetical protein
VNSDVAAALHQLAQPRRSRALATLAIAVILLGASLAIVALQDRHADACVVLDSQTEAQRRLVDFYRATLVAQMDPAQRRREYRLRALASCK